MDAQDVLVEVNEAWLDFARANWRQDFSADKVLGLRLWSQISDTTTRYVYKLLVGRVRKLGLEISFPFRCDSPDTRRFMELRLLPWSGGGVQFASRVLREEKREPLPVLDPTGPRDDLLLAMCSWCKRIRSPQWAAREPWSARVNTWWELEHLGEMLGGRHLEYPPTVSHTGCPTCYAAIMQDLEEERGSSGGVGL